MSCSSTVCSLEGAVASITCSAHTSSLTENEEGKSNKFKLDSHDSLTNKNVRSKHTRGVCKITYF